KDLLPMPTPMDHDGRHVDGPPPILSHILHRHAEDGCGGTALEIGTSTEWESLQADRCRVGVGSLNDLIGPQEQRLWDGETERLRGLEVDHQLKLVWAFDRQLY